MMMGSMGGAVWSAGTDEGQKLADVDALIGRVWAVAMQPLLFGCAGAAVTASALPQHSLAKALLLVCAGEVLPGVGGGVTGGLTKLTLVWRGRTPVRSRQPHPANNRNSICRAQVQTLCVCPDGVAW